MATAGFIYDFVGVSCWNATENRVISLELRDLKLSGQVPEPLKYCRSLQKLDIGSNALYGTIPSQICSWLPFLVTLYLSDDALSGYIPATLGKCTYLNELILSNNQFSGAIPYALGNLSRLKSLSVADNHLTGTIPLFFNRFAKEDFTGNSDLCGGSKCGGLSKKNVAVIIAAGVAGAAAALLLAFGLWFCDKCQKVN
ncbi:hypothetical protein L6164_032436 [Bauhinia variegata]|uniref:Uncharacterized protein n=1 Tax=Bauhinia variegata TaxID=167791 RepID=A0ACB9KNL6_BAUVA|nr:hypothetical protein L6164_032436 [Bauhinia variegata]